MSAAERETVITFSDADSEVRVWSAQPKFIRQFRTGNTFSEVKSGTWTDAQGAIRHYAEFTVSIDDWNPVTGRKRRRNLTDEQRAAIGARLHATR